MNKNGPVIVIEDDLDDQYMLEIVFRKLGYPNKVIYFPNGQEALDYLLNTKDMPFLILSDINMPKMDGFELQNKIQMEADLQLRGIPYLFFSTASSQDMVIKAYSLSAQGFFAKPDTIPELEIIISLIMEYWKLCEAPTTS